MVKVSDRFKFLNTEELAVSFTRLSVPTCQLIAGRLALLRQRTDKYHACQGHLDGEDY